MTDKAHQWFKERGWKAFPFQEKAWQSYLSGANGLVNAPTGSGKTYSLGLPILLEYLQEYGNTPPKKSPGLQAIWITPIRALAKEIQIAMQRACDGLNVPWEIAIRHGDTSTKERARQKRKLPEFLITTPESLHLLIAQKGYAEVFKNLKAVIADEWHELVGSKRGVQVELALSRFKTLSPKLKIWGISATIGNLDEALHVLLGSAYQAASTQVIKANIKKEIEVLSILPDTMEKFPWGGHLGIILLEKVIPILYDSKTTLIFTNTRSQAEIWYQRILQVAPDLAGVIAMHHGSINKEVREWVESSLHAEKLRAVVCTSSLDLGVDFRPVETIIQIGGPKGVSRFMQRAGRSGHQPGAKSKIYFVPTQALELVEAAALRASMAQEQLEERTPFIRSFDVLVQYLVTLAVSDGFDPKLIFPEILSTFCYESLNEDEWYWILNFITSGGSTLDAYDEFKKVEIVNGQYMVTSRRTAMRHRLSIGTIVSDGMMEVKYMYGKRIGSVEEWFIASMNIGDVFWFAGRSLELVRISGMTALVQKSNAKKGKFPSWQGGRLDLSSKLSKMLRIKLSEATSPSPVDVELRAIKPLVQKQQEVSLVPSLEEFLIESIHTREGHHLFFFPFEGRHVHEGMANLVAHRLSFHKPFSFSIAMNDYGFELLSDVDIPVEEALGMDLFSVENLFDDIQASVNTNEMSRRRFRDIASISGLVFQGYPGKNISGKHLQSSSALFYDVYREYEPNSLLLKQAFEEVMEFQLQENRLRMALERINKQKIVLNYPEKPTPFAFPILVERIRERYTSEDLKDRIKRMTLKLDR